MRYIVKGKHIAIALACMRDVAKISFNREEHIHFSVQYYVVLLSCETVTNNVHQKEDFATILAYLRKTSLLRGQMVSQSCRFTIFERENLFLSNTDILCVLLNSLEISRGQRKVWEISFRDAFNLAQS